MVWRGCESVGDEYEAGDFEGVFGSEYSITSLKVFLDLECLSILCSPKEWTKKGRPMNGLPGFRLAHLCHPTPSP